MRAIALLFVITVCGVAAADPKPVPPAVVSEVDDLKEQVAELVEENALLRAQLATLQRQAAEQALRQRYALGPEDRYDRKTREIKRAPKPESPKPAPAKGAKP